MSWDQAIETIRAHTDLKPEVGVILGSGLGAFANELSERVEFPYGELLGWPVSTAIGHEGKLVIGKIGHTVVALQSGRAHMYEGYSPKEVTFGVRVMGKLGVRSLIATNAAGGINLSFAQGALVLIKDHLNLQGANPLCGPNEAELGPRFPDMSEAYNRAYRKLAQEIAAEMGQVLNEGIYAALLGPNYETPSEIRYLRTIGADLVGMSTVPEVLVARHMGIKVLAISCVTNMAAGILDQEINHEEVLETGAQVRGFLVELLKRVIPQLEP